MKISILKTEFHTSTTKIFQSPSFGGI